MKKIFTYWKSMRRLSKWLLSIVLFLMVVIGSISAVLATQTGSRWAVLKAAHLSNMQVEGISGDLLTGLDIARIDLVSEALNLHAEKIVFRWQPLALFYDTVAVQSFAAQNIQIRLPPPRENVAKEPFAWPSFALPVRIQLANLSLRNIHLQQGEQKLQLDTISGALRLGTFRLRMRDFIISNPQFTVNTTGAIKLRYPYDMTIKSRWDFAADDTKWQGEATLGGDIKTISVQHQLSQPLTLTSVGSVSPALQDKSKKPHMELGSEWSEQQIPAMFFQNVAAQEKFPFLKSLLTMEGKLKLHGWLDDYHLDGALRGKTKDAELVADVDIDGVYKADAVNKNAPVIKWHVEKLRVHHRPLITTDENEKEQSFLQLNGDLSLSPQLKWDFLLKGEHVNLGQVFAEWPSDLQIHVASQGVLQQQQPLSLAGSRIAINQLNVQGDVRGLKLLATGAVDFDGKHWRTSDISAALGANQLSLKGKAGKDIAVEWKINAPLLNQIDPGMRGSIVSTGTLTTELNNGELAQTKMQMATQINQFAWGGYAVANLTSELKSTTNNHYQFSLKADQVDIQQQKIPLLELAGKGSIAAHNLTGTVKTLAYGRLDFILDSGWKDQQWQGQWKMISVTSQKIPQWTLLSSTPMTANKTHFDLKSLCLTTPFSDAVAASPAVYKTIELKSIPKIDNQSQQPPSICFGVNWDAEIGVSANLNAVAVPLRHASGWLKPQVALDGTLAAQATFTAKKNAAANAEFHLQSQGAQFVYQHDDSSINLYPIEKGGVDMTLKNNQMDSALVLDWGKYGIINADAKYLVADKKIQGQLTASSNDLAPLESLLPHLDDVHGSAAAKINFVGAITQPEVTGNFTLTNGSANMPQLGLELKEIGLDVSSQTAGMIAVNGQILSGDGRLMLRSTLTNMGSDNWQCQGNIFGADISIIRQPQLSANISPNLTFTANASAINLNGSTEIPWARAAIKALPSSATRVSSDVIVVAADESITPLAKKSIPFYTNVILYFGDDVQFTGFGLDGRLSGKINVLKEQNRQMLTTGFVAVNDGKYRAYGQELSIERGRLIFQGPYDNPGLDIRAVRDIESESIIDEGVRVGLDIGGTLQQPKSRVFSVPALDDSTAMALLLTGKPLDQLSAGDAYPILAAVSGMGVEGGPGITENITSFFRIDEISIKEDKDLDQNALLIGKNITPRLAVRYIVGLLDQAFTLGMSYRITNRVRVEAESGKNQSVDVIYRIER